MNTHLVVLKGRVDQRQSRLLGRGGAALVADRNAYK